MEVASPTRKVSLSSDMFEHAIDRYIDDTKPDPLSQMQMNGWTLEWSDEDDNGTTTVGLENDHATTTPPITPITPSGYQIKGTLNITGDYLVVSLHTKCRWKTLANDLHASSSSSSVQRHQYGDLDFSCHASARFLTKTEQKERRRQQRRKNKDKDKNNEESNKGVHDKIFSKMVDKLKDDAYVSKLFVLLESESEPTDPSQRVTTPSSLGFLVAEAKIHYSHTHLEERVTTSEDASEAIRRAVWPLADSPLDVVDLLFNLPFLPTTANPAHDGGSSSSSSTSTTTTTITTSLANRAKLRLLEDAMCDACEKEGEEELLEELEISEKKKQKR